VAALTGPLLAACSGTQGSAPAKNDAEVSGKVVHWSIAPFLFTEDIGAQFAAEFRAKYPKIDYQPETVVGDRFVKLQTAAAAGTAPDIGMAGSYQMQELAAAGIARAMDDYLKASRVVKQADIWPTLVNDVVYKGSQYGMPFGPDARVMFANTDQLLGAGVANATPAKTWTELEEQIRRLYRPDPPRVGFGPYWGSGGRNVWLVPFWQLGGDTLRPDGTKVTIDNEKGIQALEWLKRIHDLQGGWAATETQRTNGGTNNIQFVNGTEAYTFSTYDTRKGAEFVGAPSLKFNFAPWPLPPNGRRATYGGCHTFCITTQAKSPDAAWKVLEFLADETNNLRFATRFDRIPIRIKTAQSAAYHQNDPFLKLAADDMQYRRFVIPAPGGTEVLGLTSDFVADVMSGKQAIRTALTDASTRIQQVLDKWKR
jgi:multiple sugar transport system substrate-binding protein